MQFYVRGPDELWPSTKTVFSIESSRTFWRTLILPGSIPAIERREVMRLRKKHKSEPIEPRGW